MKIAFFGTPAFAVPTLTKLVNSDYNLTVVYTKPPKPSGRGLKEIKSLVHKIAETKKLEIRHPSNLKQDEDYKYLNSLDLDIAVTTAYGLIIPQKILDIPKFGFINIHPSNLPRWRGAAPIQRTIMSGDTSTAMCIMKMDAGLDTGDIILKKEVPIDDNITAGELHDYMANLGADMTIDVLNNLKQNDKITGIKQSEEGITYAEKIQNYEKIINWNQDARLVNCQIRSLSPHPGAYFKYKDEIIKIITANFKSESANQEKPGTIIDDELNIACKSGIIQPELLQREGKKMIYRKAFLRGFNISKGSVV